MLATAYSKVGRPSDAIRSEQQALDLALQQQDQELASHLRGKLERFQGATTAAQP